MSIKFGNIGTLISKLLFKARPSEVTIESLSLSNLQNLANYDGTLPYNNPQVRALVWEIKYYADGHAVRLAGEYLSEILLGEAAECIGTPLLIPMPMHKSRRHERGHNQTEVLCYEALKHTGVGIEYNPYVLERTRHTKPQQGLERHVRLTNLEGSMRVSTPASVKDRVCIVVDDVVTTGASFAEAKCALKAAGAKEVRTIALAQS